MARKSTCRYEGGFSARHDVKKLKTGTRSYEHEVSFPSAKVNTYGPVSYHRDTTELQLLHTWYGDTYASFTPTESEEFARTNKAWQVDVVQEAFKYEFLLPAIMSFAALHQSRLQRSSYQMDLARRYSILALEYQQEASRKFRKSLKTVNRDNHIAALTFSVLNMAISLGTTNLDLEENESERIVCSTKCPVLERTKTVFHMMQGLIQITEIAQPWLAGGPFQSVRHFQQVRKRTHFPDDNTRTTFAALSAYAREIDQARQQSCEPEIGLENSVISLQGCFNTPVSLRNSICLLWPSFVLPTFLGALQADEPAALLVVMYWGALLHKMDDKKWWVADAGHNIVKKVHSILSLIDEPRIANLKIWPLQQTLGASKRPGVPIAGCQASDRDKEGLISTSLCMI